VTTYRDPSKEGRPTALVSKHILSYCDLCQSKIVICASCGNNCCNGGSGQVPVGGIMVPCGDCDEAYEHQEKYLADPDSVILQVGRK